ncbi:GH36-type glycosyl hydrolase domain-containing protein [Arenicella xantha]|uniref:Cellobionic acid phosphorylase n=1 Tax=Arenicella xantha TaxID=644221 RepID=A0A395JRV7_9GAMM|nr:NdvB protein [Arenicella xantha]RBP53176.1 cellobionic acid phosphorylase [Arenicella xantha]
MSIINVSDDRRSITLLSPTDMPAASAFLWNSSMMMQVNCRGYATAQFMQPEPAKYAYAPNLEAKTFMQPEQPYYAHHPGRFFYLKDLDTNELFSAPYEPVRNAPDSFEFIARQDTIAWKIQKSRLSIEITLSLSPTRPLELWQINVTNLSEQPRRLSLVPYFPVGYMSWMNQSAMFRPELSSIVCSAVTPYQKYPDYFKQRDFKDLTFLLAESFPDAWETRQSAFEGEGGLHAPSALHQERLSNSDAIYETPTAALQYQLTLQPGANKQFRFAFGPANDHAEIASISNELFGSETGFDEQLLAYKNYLKQSESPLKIATPDAEFDDFVNHWLGRQVFYHGDVNRLSTDPQTRNYLQDAMGMSYLKPERTRDALLRALSQQQRSGAMPDGILLSESAELKYINQIPHMDHCVWLPVCLSAYLDETGDLGILNQPLSFADSDDSLTVQQHIDLALLWLFEQRDHRDLNYIAQGDWCDPMNMVGYKGKGVSAWLTLATAYASQLWANICQDAGRETEAKQFNSNADALNAAVNTHLWTGDWYARGITDDDVVFGVPTDTEGRIFLNPQAWAILSGAASEAKQASMIDAIERDLETPYGVQMLAPAYTKMREDVGRVTQKHPGSAENGSVYNHAAGFYVYALYQAKQPNRAFRLLRQMIPGPDDSDLQQRGQLPVFIPNYYRGAYREYPRTAGRSSQLFNTGTVHWFLRCLIDGLFGVRGTKEGLKIDPQLPQDWPQASLDRHFRGADFHIEIVRKPALKQTSIIVNGERLADTIIRSIDTGKRYSVTVEVP